MASKTTVELIDDMDGKPAAETITFGLDGRDFEIDLSEKNAAKLREALKEYVGVARRVGGRKGRTVVQVETVVDTKAVRAWAESNGYEVSSRGRISAGILQAYRDAGN